MFVIVKIDGLGNVLEQLTLQILTAFGHLNLAKKIYKLDVRVTVHPSYETTCETNWMHQL